MKLTVARLGHLGDGIADGPSGPVFVPRLYAPYTPAGTIEAGYWFNDRCLYLALDDQMAATGFRLM